MARVIQALCWKNFRTGRTASVTGAPPWGTLAPDPDWVLITEGYTVEHRDGTRGVGRAPFETKEEAERWIAANPRFPGWRSF